MFGLVLLRLFTESENDHQLKDCSGKTSQDTPHWSILIKRWTKKVKLHRIKKVTLDRIEMKRQQHVETALIQQLRCFIYGVLVKLFQYHILLHNYSVYFLRQQCLLFGNCTCHNEMQHKKTQCLQGDNKTTMTTKN